MRIVGGEHKGRQLQGKLPSGIRPTLDAVRESIYNILNNYFAWEETTMADICSGSGAMGLEALSRGAKKVYFVDKSKQACIHIKKMIGILKTPANRYEILNLDAVKAVAILKANEGQFDFIFTDPPYNSPFIELLLEQIAATDLLEEDGVFGVEIAKDENISIPESFSNFREKKYGGSKVLFLENK